MAKVDQLTEEDRSDLAEALEFVLNHFDVKNCADSLQVLKPMDMQVWLEKASESITKAKIEIARKQWMDDKGMISPLSRKSGVLSIQEKYEQEINRLRNELYKANDQLTVTRARVEELDLQPPGKGPTQTASTEIQVDKEDVERLELRAEVLRLKTELDALRLVARDRSADLELINTTEESLKKATIRVSELEKIIGDSMPILALADKNEKALADAMKRIKELELHIAENAKGQQFQFYVPIPNISRDPYASPSGSASHSSCLTNCPRTISTDRYLATALAVGVFRNQTKCSQRD
jgi:hypothetical protein